MPKGTSCGGVAAAAQLPAGGIGTSSPGDTGPSARDSMAWWSIGRMLLALSPVYRRAAACGGVWDPAGRLVGDVGSGGAVWRVPPLLLALVLLPLALLSLEPVSQTPDRIDNGLVTCARKHHFAHE